MIAADSIDAKRDSINTPLNRPRFSYGWHGLLTPPEGDVYFFVL
jgi:hypothetical protein